MQSRSMNAKEWGMLLVLSLLWGSSFYFAEVALADYPPFTLAFLRVLLAAAVLVSMALAMGHAFPASAAAWRRYTLLGLLSNAMPFCLIYWGQTAITGGLASILTATTPFFTIILAHVLTNDEKFSLRKMFGVLTGIAGVAVIMGQDAFNGEEAFLPKLAVLGGAVCYAAAGVYGKRFMGEPLIVVSACQLVASALMLLPLMLAFEAGALVHMPSAQGAAAVAAVAVLSTALAFLFYFRILRSAGATNVVLVTLLVPVSAIVLGVVLLSEPLLARHLLGLAIIATGLVVIDGRIFRPFAVRAKPSTENT